MENTIFKKGQTIQWMVFAMLVAVGCDSSNDATVTSEVKTAQVKASVEDNSNTATVTQDILDITDDALSGNGISGGRLGGDDSSSSGRTARCDAKIISDYDKVKTGEKNTYSYKGTITIDYGEGTTCNESKRKGKIFDTFEYTIKHNTDSSRVTVYLKETITFENFTSDTLQVEGTFITISETDKPTSVEAQKAKITYEDGTSVSWDATHTHTYVEGEKKERPWEDDSDDSEEVIGSSNGKNREGKEFTATITSALVYAYACEDINGPVKGAIDLVVNGTKSVVDYGTGTCDKVYTITTDGETKEYTFD